MNPNEWRTQIPQPLRPIYDEYCKEKAPIDYLEAHDKLFSLIKQIPESSLTYTEKMAMYCRPAVKYCSA